MICKNQRKDKLCLDAKNQARHNKNSTILDQILSNQRSPENKASLGYESLSDKICDKNEDFISKHQDASQKKSDIFTKQIKLKYDNPFSYKDEFHTMKCFRCNYVVHVTNYCYTIRCYMCDGLDISLKIVQRK